jgi:secretion/DNA translocation related TadE-like protein
VSGSVLSIAIASGVAALAAASLPLYGALATRQSVVAAADAAALAAADVAVGIAPGFPCESAARAAAANGAAVLACRTDGLVATVTAGRSILGIPVTATATAGPPR